MGKTPADRIKRIRKRTKQLVTDPAEALGDLEKHIQKTVSGTIKTTQKNIEKSQTAVKETSKTIVTSTGRYINLHGKEIALGFASLAVGMKMKQVASLFEPTDEGEKEIVYRGMGLDEYLESADKNQENFSDEDWHNIVSQTSTRLEAQLRTILGLSIVKKYNLNKLLELAEEDNSFQPNEFNKLHHFRKEVRNKVLHSQKVKLNKSDRESVIWTAKFMKNLEEEKITEISE